VYKHASERNGARVAIHAVKRVARATRSCLAPQGVRSVWLKRRIDPAQARRKHDTMEDVSGRSSILSQWERIHSPTGEDGGTTLVTRVKPTPDALEGVRGGSYRSAWNRTGGARGRQGRQRTERFR